MKEYQFSAFENSLYSNRFKRQEISKFSIFLARNFYENFKLSLSSITKSLFIKYSRVSITQTLKGNQKSFELRTYSSYRGSSYVLYFILKQVNRRTVQPGRYGLTNVFGWPLEHEYEKYKHFENGMDAL